MRFLKSLPIVIFGAVFAISGCSQEKRTAEIYGTVYWAEVHIIPNSNDTTREDTIMYLNPAPDVQVYLEQDQGSDIPYQGEDLYTTTNSDGEYTFTVYLGRNYDPNTLMYEEISMCDVRLAFLWTPNRNFVLQNGDTARISGQFTTELTGVTVRTGNRVKAPDVVVGSVFFR